jgi:hypothetical protein
VANRVWPVSLGPFDFQFTRGEINAYRKALGFSGSEEVPVTFATRALTEPVVLAELRAVFGDQIAVHIEQSIDILEALRPEIHYQLNLVLEVLRNTRMGLTGTFTGPSNGVCVVMRSEFLLIQKTALE